MKRTTFILSLLWVLTACQPTDGLYLAQIGEERLSLNEVLLQMPMGVHGEDSARFVNDYVDNWVDEQLMYYQGLKHVPDLDRLENQARQYRRDLIAQTYCNERLMMSDNQVTEEECQAFYDENQKDFRLDVPVIQCVFIQLLSNSSKVNRIKEWLAQIKDGNMDHAEDLEQYCQLRAVAYESYFDHWVPLSRLTDMLPADGSDLNRFMKVQVSEMKDKDYIYLYMISDFKAKGDIQPYEFAKKDIMELLIQRERGEHRKQLQQELRSEALKSGLLKLKN
ncbi:MAG: hypothetical protein IJP70_05605 [Bacteroidales bacterium]|nr:hypothetical protein [Bacteroidales bacterium]